MNIKGILIYFGLLIVIAIIAILWEKYGPDDEDEPTPPGFRWGD